MNNKVILIGTLVGVLFASALHAKPAGTKDKFDLICSIDGKSDHFSFDLTKKLYCDRDDGSVCKEAHPIHEVTPEHIIYFFVRGDSPSNPDFHASYFAINRTDGRAYMVFQGNDPKYQGTCTKAPFTELPKLPEAKF